jgi:CBS-domain-containing membrane protein
MHFHFDIVDPKLRRDPLRYVLQCLLVVLALSVVLAVGDALARAVVIAAIGSTAFVLFIMPHSDTASARHVLGGHLIALAVGGAASALDPVAGFSFSVQGALAVGVSIFLMAATNTEHAPAAGTALGVVAHGSSWSLALFLASSVLALVVIHRLLRPWLRDLY